MSQPRLLVVGGSGFIGRHVVSRAGAMNWDVTCLSLNTRQLPKGVSSVVADLSDRTALNASLADARFDYVVNCGGYIDHTLFKSGGRKLLESHFDGLMNLVEILDRSTLKSFVNIGSSDEYGSGLAPQAESLREAPISPYSLGKTAATHFLQMLHRTEALPTTTLRLFLTYGPGQSENRFIPQIIRGCLKDVPFPVSGGQQLRDFCFIDDTIRAIFMTLESAKARGEVLNIASGQPITIREMIENVRRMVGRGQPQFGQLAYRPGENMALYADISRAKALLGWTPEVDISEGLKRTLSWMESQK